MPLVELMLYLSQIGDAIVEGGGCVPGIREREGATLETRNGLTYVCASNGTEMRGEAWVTKYIWVRV